jgi:hypothetical protein
VLVLFIPPDPRTIFTSAIPSLVIAFRFLTSFFKSRYAPYFLPAHHRGNTTALAFTETASAASSSSSAPSFDRSSYSSFSFRDNQDISGREEEGGGGGGSKGPREGGSSSISGLADLFGGVGGLSGEGNDGFGVGTWSVLIDARKLRLLEDGDAPKQVIIMM